MDYPIYIDTIIMELFILYFKVLMDKNSMKRCISAPEDFLSKQTMQTLKKCDLTQHFIWVFSVSGIQTEKTLKCIMGHLNFIIVLLIKKT